MKILVTGGLGLIGRGVIRALGEAHPECTVRIFDYRNASATEARELGNAEVMQGDVCDPDCVDAAVRGCERVLHLAGDLGVQKTESDHLTCLETNVIATRGLLDACTRHGVKRVMLASSSEVYGETPGYLSEVTEVRPRSVYAVAKLAAEKYALAYKQRHGLDVRVTRFFNVYGAGQRGDFVMSRFVERLRRGVAPEVFGDGSQVRCFCHVDDAARGVLAVLFAVGLEDDLFNIGNDKEPISIRDLAVLATRVAGMACEPDLVPFENSDRSATREIKWRAPDITRMRTQLGYEPTTALAQGLKRLLESPLSPAAIPTTRQLPRIIASSPRFEENPA